MKTYFIILKNNSIIEIEAANEKIALDTVKLMGLVAVKIAH